MSGSQVVPEKVLAVVIGAGPAGMSAAIALAEAGIDALTIDEAAAPGGRIWRATPPPLRHGRESPEIVEGNRLRARAKASGASVLTRAVVWSVGRDGDDWRIDVLTPDGSRSLRVRLLLVAVGTVERVIPFPGWTLPGVVSLAGSTILLKSQHMAPGRRVAVAGAGPLLASVAAGVLKAGSRVAAVADIASRREWLSAAPALASHPALALRGAGWMVKLLRAGILPQYRTGVVKAEGAGQVEAVILAPVGEDGAPIPGAPTRRVACDALAIGHGLAPATEITRVLRAEHTFNRDLGGWRPVTDAEGRTSLSGLYVAGDGAGVRGAVHACEAGARTAAAMVADLEGARAGTAAKPAIKSPIGRLGIAMSRLTRQRPAMTAAIPPNTVVCRCEDVTRGEIDAAIESGATDVNQLKHFTRCGMGPCQGRSCGDVAAELLALRMLRDGRADGIDSARRSVGQWTGRTPLRPVPLADLVGSFTYDDIPVPEPAPL